MATETLLQESSSASSENPQLDQDTPWKNILGEYFRPFMELCLSPLSQQIDWERGYESLDKELNKAVRYSKTGNRRADKLIKVWLKDNQEIWILFHVEVQGYYELEFPERMYIYNYRLRDFYRRPIVSVAILIDSDDRWRPSQYNEGYWGCSTEFRFIVIKIWDFRSKKEELEAMDNPFALVILSQLALLETRKDPYSLFQLKINLTRRLYRRGWPKKQILDFYFFIDGLIVLPEELMIKYDEMTHQIEEENKVAYISTAELCGHRRGFQSGEAALLTRLLTVRFGTLSDYHQELLQQADADTLLLWSEKIFTAKKLEDIFI